MSARGGVPKLTLNLWEVGDGPDPEQVGYLVLAATMDDAARDRWGADLQLGSNRAGVCIATDATGSGGRLRPHRQGQDRPAGQLPGRRVGRHDRLQRRACDPGRCSCLS